MKIVEKEVEANIVVVAEARGWNGDKPLTRTLIARIKASDSERWDIENCGGLHNSIVDDLEDDLQKSHPSQDWSVRTSWTRSPVGRPKPPAIKRGLPKVDYAEVTEVKISENPPVPRIGQDGWTLKGGSPTELLVKIKRSKVDVWRRVYTICVSNSPSYFIKSKEYGDLFIPESHLNEVYK